MSKGNGGPSGGSNRHGARGAPDPEQDVQKAPDIDFVRRPTSEFGSLTQPEPQGEPTKSAAIGNTWSKDSVDSREYVPVSERPLLQRILDLPHELMRMVKEAFLPLPSRSIGELKGRAQELLRLSESEASQIAHRDVVALISAAAERYHHDPRARVNDLIDAFSRNRAKNREEGFVVKVSRSGDTLEVKITANSYVQRFLRASDSDLSRTKTREIIATVLEVADTLIKSEYAPDNLKVTVRSALGARQADIPFLWEVVEADLYRVGFQSGREIKLALKNSGGNN